MTKSESKSSDATGDRKMLGERLKEAREYLGFSQEEIATHVGIPRSALSLVETGQRRVDALELKRLAMIYKRPVAFFTGETAADAEDASVPADVQHLARKVAELSASDREELSRFADFLRARTDK
jgi:transcriptional regulator with XRE-family HTH domain